jgi:hypothetical protein
MPTALDNGQRSPEAAPRLHLTAAPEQDAADSEGEEQDEQRKQHPGGCAVHGPAPAAVGLIALTQSTEGSRKRHSKKDHANGKSARDEDSSAPSG